MSLRKYGIEIKAYLEEYKPLMFQNLVMNGTIMEYLKERENEIKKFAMLVEKQLKENTPIPKTNEFEVIVRYNIQIESIVNEIVKERFYSL
ncbi:MAG: TnpV protein [Clostridia bacterium]